MFFFFFFFSRIVYDLGVKNSDRLNSVMDFDIVRGSFLAAENSFKLPTI